MDCVVINFKCYERRMRKPDSQLHSPAYLWAGDTAPSRSAELRAESRRPEVHGTLFFSRLLM